jgi:cytochrome bd-type quinol oxidase subunit 2
MAQSAPTGKRPVTRVAITVLLLVAIGGTLVVPIYARSMPKLGDFPFFYWYQLILVPAVAVLCWLCSVLLRAEPTAAARPADDGEMRK